MSVKESVCKSGFCNFTSGHYCIAITGFSTENERGSIEKLTANKEGRRGGRASWGDNDRSQLENKAKVKIMTTEFIGGGGDFSYCRKIQYSEFFLFCFFFPQLYLCG